MNKLPLVAIIILAIFVRLYNIREFPPSVNWDEASLGYNAFSLLKTGNDEWGQKTPLIFKAFGDYKLPVYVYLSVPFIYLLGLNEYSTRAVSVLAGVFLVPIIYLLCKRFGLSRKSAILASGVAAFSPWTIFLSRIASEANLSLLFFAGGLLSIQYKSFKAKIISISLFSIAAFTYNSARVAAIPFLAIVLIQIIRTKVKLNIIFGVLAILFFWTQIISQFSSGEAGARYRAVQILDSGAISKIEEARNSSGLPYIVKRLAYNKPIYFGIEFVKNFSSYLNPRYIFWSGGSQYQYSIPGFYLVSYLFLPVYLLGVYIVLFNKRYFRYRYLIFLLVVSSIIPGSITREAPHALRSIYLILPLIILISFGFEAAFSKRKGKYLHFVFWILLISGLFAFWQKYQFWRLNYSWSLQYGYKEAIEYINSNSEKYNSIIFTKKNGEPHIFYLYYSKIDPYYYQNSKEVVRFYQSNWYWVDRIGKIFFVNDWQVTSNANVFTTESGIKIDCSLSKCLLISSPNNHPSAFNKIFDINFLNGQPAFTIYEN